MEQEVFDRYVKGRYQGQMNYYSDASRKNQKVYKLLQWILIVLSALTPVLAALKGIKLGTAATATPPAFDLNIFLLVVSSTVAILTTGLKTFNYQELWINARTTYERLKPEIHYYEFNVGPYALNGVDKESLFVSRVELILDTEHSHWPPAKSLQDKDNRSGGVEGSTKQKRPSRK